MHLLQSGTDLNMIRSWLGHASIETTNLYVEIDLEMKQKTLQSCEKLLPKTGRRDRHGNEIQIFWIGCQRCSYVKKMGEPKLRPPNIYAIRDALPFQPLDKLHITDSFTLHSKCDAPHLLCSRLSGHYR